MSPALAGRFFTLHHLGSPTHTAHIFRYIYVCVYPYMSYLLCLFAVYANLTIGNKAAGYVYNFEFTLLFSSDPYPGMELLGHIISSVFSLLRNFYTVFHSGYDDL